MGIVESDSNMDLGSMDPGFTQGQIATVEISTALAEERDREIQQIVGTIVELAQVRGQGLWDLGRGIQEETGTRKAALGTGRKA